MPGPLLDEGLRLAYLEAMGIPVWVPRDHVADPATGVSGLADAAPAAPRQALKELLGTGDCTSAGEVSALPLSSTESAASGAVPDGQGAQVWILAWVGDLLFVDALGDAELVEPRKQFFANLQRALTGSQQTEGIELFRWPPAENPALNPDMLPDVLSGRMQALCQAMPVRAIHLFGEQVATVFARAGIVAAMPCPLIHHPPADQIMRSAADKRALWSVLSRESQN